MHANDVTPERVRTLSERRARRGKVLSLYLNLDPREFDTAKARSSAVGSLLHDAREQVEGYTAADHEAKKGLRDDLQRLEDDVLAPDQLPGDGAQALAVFADGPDDLLEVLRLPRPVASRVVVDETPHVEPLLSFSHQERWCVALVNRSLARFLMGTRDNLAEITSFDDDTHSSHDQGGWSQARWERAVDEEVRDHYARVGEALAAASRRNRFERLLLAAPHEQLEQLEEALPADVRGKVEGHLTLDVGNVSVQDAEEAAREAIHRREDERLEETLANFEKGLAAPEGRAAGGLDQVLAMLVERRVEALLLRDGFSRPGLRDPDTGWLGIEGQRPPTDGVERVEDITEDAIALALEQEAVVVRVPPEHEERLRPHDGIGAVLRF